MKKMLLSLIALLACVPIITSQEYGVISSEKVTLFTAEIPTDEIPLSVKKAVSVRFNKDDPRTWSRFPFTFREYGCVYEAGADGEMPMQYEVRMKTTKGDYMWGTYAADGDLIQTREKSRNIAIPHYILEALAKSDYRDWKIVGNKEIINVYKSSGNLLAKQNMKLNLGKDSERKKIAFSYEASTGKLEARLIR
jgi:hypothetical protein